MWKFLRQNLLLLSTCVVVSACASSPVLEDSTGPVVSSCIQHYPDMLPKTVYHASVDAGKRHLSGILIFKNTAPNITRAVFTSETGLTFFDFEFSGNQFRVVSIMKNLNRKPVIKTLRNDIGLLIRFRNRGTSTLRMIKDHQIWEGFEERKNTTWYVSDSLCTSLQSIQMESKRKTYIHIDWWGTGFILPDSAIIRHLSYPFTIHLKKLTE
jgi:hypothetical protein